MTDGNRNETISIVVEYSPWLKLEQLDWGAITSDIVPKLYKKGTSIYQQQQYSDYVYIVKSGRVRLSIYSHDGKEKYLIIGDRGYVFGELSALDGYPNFANSTAIVDSHIYLVPKKRFIEELNRNHDLCLQVIKMQARKIRLLSSQVEGLSFDDAYYRVVNTLVYLVEQYGLKTEKGHKIRLKFTHQEMANLIGSCRVTVTNVFRSLSNQNTIKRERGYFYVTDVNRLYHYLDVTRPFAAN